MDDDGILKILLKIPDEAWNYADAPPCDGTRFVAHYLHMQEGEPDSIGVLFWDGESYYNRSGDYSVTAEYINSWALIEEQDEPKACVATKSPVCAREGCGHAESDHWDATSTVRAYPHCDGGTACKPCQCLGYKP